MVESGAQELNEKIMLGAVDFSQRDENSYNSYYRTRRNSC